MTDGQGLSLYAACNGRKSWHFRFSWQGRQCRISLGVFPSVSLSEARILCQQAHALLGKGIGPRAFRRQLRFSASGCLLFRAFARSWLAFKLQRLDMVASREFKHGGVARRLFRSSEPLSRIFCRCWMTSRW
ncbi:Arm DNA-binding domain-containing protein [Utexia brackfieldae]|uniref:Arm DNA-binding domain-containing protein n=1 Tax=Utexia brackfieldae TaxID=3074108 RepID=UPI00370D8D2D